MKQFSLAGLLFTGLLLLLSCQPKTEPVISDYNYLEEITLQQL